MILYLGFIAFIAISTARVSARCVCSIEISESNNSHVTTSSRVAVTKNMQNAIFSLKTNRKYRFLVKCPNETLSGVDLFFVSHDAIVPAHKSGNSRGSTDYNVHYSIFHEKGLYNISIRGDNPSCRISSLSQSKFPLAQLGFVHGQHRELFTQTLYQVQVTKEFDSSLNRDTLPSCRFDHEILLSKGIGNPRWVRMNYNHSANSLYDIWHTDAYEWLNNICVYSSVTKDMLRSNMMRNGYKTILFIGDSLTRFMYGDMEDLFTGITASWLKSNPLEFIGNDTNWDGYVSGWTTYTQKCSNCIHLKRGFREENPTCCLDNSCNETAEVHLHEFLPGFISNTDAIPTAKNDKRKSIEWESFFETNYINYEPQIPSIIVFNAGLWMLSAYPNEEHHEIQALIEGILRLCKKHNIIFIWRNTFYHQRDPTNDRINQLNDAAIKKLLEFGYSKAYFLGTSNILSRVRPDRTSDGFHYSYRKRRSTWHYCSENDQETLDKDCIRSPDWPMSVSKSSSNILLNYIINSQL